MTIIDGHCDALYKMWRNPAILFKNDRSLQVTYDQMMQVNSKIQFFAIYVPPSVPPRNRFHVALEMINLCYEKIINPFPNLILIKDKKEISALKPEEIGIILSIEGIEPIEDDLLFLKTLFRLGVFSVGLTWNQANLAADGALETRNAGLSHFGKRVIKLNNQYGKLTDLSHLGEKSFYETIANADKSFASHSNVYEICPHPRNLKREQIEAIIAKKGIIGLTFVPEFVYPNHPKLDHMIAHIEYIAALGGENCIGFGSDFDGMDDSMQEMSCMKDYERLYDHLTNYYSDEFIRKIMHDNFLNFLNW